MSRLEIIDTGLAPAALLAEAKFKISRKAFLAMVAKARDG